MSRYIGEDKGGYIDRKELLNIIAERKMPESSNIQRYYQWVCDWWTIVDAPSVDVVEVVRCKNCKYWLKNKHDKPLCTCIDRVTYGTDYCSYGEEQEHE